MTSDPNDFIYVEAQVGPDRRRSRRHVTLTDGDWRPVGDAAAPGGADGRLRARIVVNKIALDLEVVASGWPSTTSNDMSPRDRVPPAAPTLRVRGRQYRLVSVYAP